MLAETRLLIPPLPHTSPFPWASHLELLNLHFQEGQEA